VLRQNSCQAIRFAADTSSVIKPIVNQPSYTPSLSPVHHVLIPTSDRHPPDVPLQSPWSSRQPFASRGQRSQAVPMKKLCVNGFCLVGMWLCEWAGETPVTGRKGHVLSSWQAYGLACPCCYVGVRSHDVRRERVCIEAKWMWVLANVLLARMRGSGIIFCDW